MTVYPSNTATPVYYEEFRKTVMRGDLPICREISLEMNRIDRLIENPAYYYITVFPTPRIYCCLNL